MQQSTRNSSGFFRRLKSAAALLYRRALDLLYPPRAICAGCGTGSGCEADYLCAECLERLERSQRGFHLTPEDSKICGRAHAFGYAGAASGVVRALKYHSVRPLARIMAEEMVRALSTPAPGGPSIEVPYRFDCIVYVPMHFWRRWLRGMDHAELLAREVSQILDIPVLPALVRARRTPQQARLDKEHRAKNLMGAFRLKEDVRTKSILLIDDVFTTGATCEECAKVLMKGKATRVFALTYAVSDGH